MHILLIPSWYKNKERKVFGTFFEEQARALMSAGHKAGIFAPGFIAFSQNYPLWKEVYDDNGLPTYSIRVKNKLPGLRKLAFKAFLKKCDAFFREYITKEGKPDIIHAHSVFYGGYVSQFISRKYNIPYVITEHNTSFITGEISSKSDLFLARNTFKSATERFAVSSSFATSLSALFFNQNNQFKVLPNMVDDLFFNTYKKDQNRSEINLFTVSYLVPRKNISMLINAANILIRKGRKVNVIIGGYGPERMNLEILAVKLDILSSVQFLGEISREQVATSLSTSDIYIQTSEHETFGVALTEALAVGLPAISTDCGGPSDIITKNNGIILDGFTAEELAEKIGSVFDNKEKYDSRSIKSDCRNRFSKEALIEKLNETYSSIIQN